MDTLEQFDQINYGWKVIKIELNWQWTQKQITHLVQ